jgi:N-acetylmuramoyl-L-alanine amidase
MRVENIPGHEADFDRFHKDSSEKLFNYVPDTVEIPGEAAALQVVKLEPVSGDQSFYFASSQPKTQIVLHYTAGYLKGDIAALTHHDYHVSVPYLIGRNGTIYNLFTPDYWAYHLGPGAVGGNEFGSRRTIAIEISNIGGLQPTSQGLQNYYGEIYCLPSQGDAYMERPFRRFTHFATFTDAQYQSLNLLLHYLTARYQIRREFLKPEERFLTTTGVKEFNGITSHINYRSSGKEDIGPAFDWDRMRADLNEPL